MPPGVPSFNNMSPQDMVIKSGKLVAKNAISTLEKTAPPGRIVSSASAGRDVIQSSMLAKSSSGRDIVSGKKALSSSAGHDIIISGKKSSTTASHDILLSGKATETASANRGHVSSQSTHPPGTTRVPSGSILRWRVSSSRISTRTDRATPSGVPSAVSCTALDVHSQDVRTTVPGAILSGVVPVARGIHPGGTSIAPGLQRLSVSTLPAGMLSLPRDQLASPRRLGLSGSVDRSPEIFGNGLVHSLVSVGGMLSSSVALCAQISLSTTNKVEGALYRGLSLAGRYLLSARKAFNWQIMRT